MEGSQKKSFLATLTATGPAVLHWYCKASRPARNTVLPVTEMQVNSALPLPASARSPMLPPQPRVEPSAPCDCHTDCWSLCENSLGGSGTLPPKYWRRVVGTTSGPTFNCTAAWPALNSPANPVMDGCSANSAPPGSGARG